MGGNLKNNEHHGEGTLYDKNGIKVYEGNFENNKFHGEGTGYIEGYKAYEGNFDNGKMSGKDIVYNENGNKKYEGNFENNGYHGEGTLYDENGIKGYEGNFDNGHMSGKGIVYNENGNKRYEGNFENNKYHGEGTLYDENGIIVFDGFFENGSQIIMHHATILYDENANNSIEEGRRQYRFRKRKENQLKRKRDDGDDGSGKKARCAESQHFTNSCSSINGGKEFDIEAIYKTNLFPQEVPKPQLTTTYKERPITVELTMSQENKGVGWYQEDSEMDYKLTVNFKIKENKLDAELDIKESEKEIVEEPVISVVEKPPMPLPDCLACYDGKRYSFAVNNPKRKGHIPCYQTHLQLRRDYCHPKTFAKRNPDKVKSEWEKNCVTKVKQRKKAENKKVRNQQH